MSETVFLNQLDDTFTIVATLGFAHVKFKVYEEHGQLIGVEGVMLPEPLTNYHSSIIDPDGYEMDTQKLEEAQVYLSGEISVNGCSNWHFDEQDRNMLHFCGQGDAKGLGELMGRLYEIAAELMPESNLLNDD